MAMGMIVEFLGSDHRACDDLFVSAENAVALKGWANARSLFERFESAMAHHFAMEEAVLFPAFEARTGMSMGPTQVMRSEHEQMRGLIRDMAQALAGSDQDNYLGQSETLNMLMQQHNLKEENMLYPMSDQVLAPDRDQLIQSMQATRP